MDNNTIKNFYDSMEKNINPVSAIFIFVYNDFNTYLDDPHLEECFDDEEVHEIIDSVCDLFEETIALRSEKEFIEWCVSQNHDNRKVYVYSMAQYIDGFSRRTLIPALCQYYGFINLNADAYVSAVGCNKKTMYRLLAANNLSGILAPTIFCQQYQEIDFKEVWTKLGNHIILKPISESCCIDTIILENYTESQLLSQAAYILEKYGYVMIQKYILGREIGVTTVCCNKEIYTLEPIEIIFQNGKTHLTHADSYYQNYQLKACQVSSELLEICKKISIVLDFYCTARYDFRFDGEKYFLFDLSPNPTINGFTSSNFAARETLGCDYRGILRLMVYEKVNLFEPPFK